MPQRAFPLPLRNALARLSIAALEDPRAARGLAWLAERHGVPAAGAAEVLAAEHLIALPGLDLLPAHAPHATAAAEHARRALNAVAHYRPCPEPDPIRQALRRATALWDMRLFFEVHEVLEAVWHTARGDVREALQGLIQIGVAFYQLAHGNLFGARSLLAEGRARLAAAPSGTLPDLDAGALLADTAVWETALTEGRPPATAPPRLPCGGA